MNFLRPKRKQTVVVVTWSDTNGIWGIFSTIGKANAALRAWGKQWEMDFDTRVITVDYRSPKDAIRYQSDFVHSVDRDNAVRMDTQSTRRDYDLHPDTPTNPDST